jgi:hypothetical protein
MTFGNLPQFDKYWVPEEFKEKNKQLRFETAAYYQNETGAVVSVKIYNQMDQLSQAGLWLHEAIRQLQIDYGAEMSEKALETITAKILLEDPYNSLSLDDPSLYGPTLGKVIQEFKPSESLLPKQSMERFLKRINQFAKTLPENSQLQGLVQIFKTNNTCSARE